jgi:hypothetical protein
MTFLGSYSFFSVVIFLRNMTSTDGISLSRAIYPSRSRSTHTNTTKILNLGRGDDNAFTII